MILGIISAPWLELTTGTSFFISLGSGIVSTVLIAGLGWLMPRRTTAGTRMLEEVRGYELFMARVNRDRIDRTLLTVEAFEQGLPYAMAFGLSRRWAEAFEPILRHAQSPTWFSGGRLGADAWGMDLDHFSSSTAAVLVSTPRSSSDSSGFGEGDSVGGGFGGGSVGGF